MNCTCKVEQRRLTPGVFNLKQFLNGTETMTWELDSCQTNEGTCDLRNYDAFLVLSVGGEIDEIMLTKRQTGDTLQLLWNVGTYATALTGYVKYQITFRSATFDTLGVIAEDPEANGTYSLTDQDLAGDARIFQKAENGYQIKWDAANGRWAIYQADGETVVDYQTTPSTEPHCGTWNNVAVGNNEAAAWISDEAIMYISESIAADQAVTAGYPTILRQLWARLQKSGVTSVNGKSGIVELFPEDIGAAADDHVHAIAEQPEIKEALEQKADTAHTHTTADVTDLAAALAAKSDTGHSHQIADTDGLQEALDGKAPTEHGHIIGNTTGLQEALDGKLPLSGGTMTGQIEFNTAFDIRNTSGDNTRTTYIRSSSNSTGGAYLALRGKDVADSGGAFTIVAADGTNSMYFSGLPNGRLTWGGKEVERVNASGTYYIRYESGLQICWGTLSANATATGRSQTLPAAFVNASYSLAISQNSSASTDYVVYFIQSKTASAFTYTCMYGGTWIAVGKWK